MHEYKALMKLQTNDSSLISRQQADLNRILRNVERWISETKLALAGSAFDFDGPGEGSDGEDWREALVMDHLCDSFLVKGGLLRVSKK